ncbi:MAG: tetratricopeptide repeat protein [Cyanobacteria bacterium J06627_8]
MGLIRPVLQLLESHGVGQADARSRSLKRVVYTVGLSLFVLLGVVLGTPNSLASPLTASAAEQPFETQMASNSSFFQAGVQFSHEGNYHAALIAFSKAIQNDHELASAYANRCLIFIQLNQHHEAIADCSMAISLNPNHLNAYLNRGLAWYRRGDSVAAIQDFTTVLQRRPYDVQAHYNRGLAEAVRGDLEQSVDDFNQAFRHVLSDDRGVLANILSDRGVTRLQQGNSAGAIADLTLALRLNHGDPEIYFNRACAYQYQGAIAQARHDFTAAIAGDATFAQAYVNRGMLHHRLGHHQRAIDDLNVAADLFKKQGNAIAYQHMHQVLKKLFADLSAIG